MSHRQPRGQTKETSMGMAGVAVVALIVGALIAWLIVDQAIGAQKVGGEAEERPALLLGNESLPPMNFMKQGKPTGIVVDLAKAVAERMHRPVEIQLMKWTEAQQLVLEGRADALLHIDPNPERLKIYDFSAPLLDTEFTIFTSAKHLGVASISDLRGLKVGVEEKGLPILLLQKDPQIIVKIIPDFVQGFRMLATGVLDAVVADRWVGSYVLAENNIRGVKLSEEPIGRSHSAIAVKKGNTNLLGDINAALADIRRDGTYDRIVKSWRSKEVVFKTREQLRQETWFITAISAALIAALLSIAALIMEIRRRKRGETALRASGARLDLALLAAHMGVWHWDIIVDRRWFDDQVCHLLGIDPAKFSGTGGEFFDAVHPEDHYKVRAALVQTIEHGTPYESEYRAIWPDGSIHHIIARGKLVSDNEGRPIRLNGLIWDITERRRTEEALWESEERLRRLGDNLPKSAVYQYAHEPDGRVHFLYISAGIEQLNGVSAQEVLNDAHTLHRLTLPEDYERLVEAEAKSARELSDFDMEVQMRRPDGQLRWMHLHSRPRRLPDGSTVWDGVQADVTERKNAEEALRLSEEKFAIAFADNPAAIALTRFEDGLVREVNDTYLTMFGYSRDEVIGHSTLNLNIWPTTDDRARQGEDLREKGGFRNREQTLLMRWIRSSWVTDYLLIPCP
jgi:PAS domain S-box-containing protein